MRRAILALTMVGSGLGVLVSTPAQAVGTRYPFCLTGEDQPGLSNCTFTSYEQCAATASGRRLYCIQNPYFAGDGDAPPAYGRGAPPPPPPLLFPPPFRN